MLLWASDFNITAKDVPIVRIDVKRFYPASNGIFRQRETYNITYDLIIENGFKCVQRSDNLKECLFEKNEKQYKFDHMEYWTFNKLGETGLDIDQIRMELITK